MRRTFFPSGRKRGERPSSPDAGYAGKLRDLPSQLVFIMGCHRSGTSMLYHLLAYTGQIDWISAYDIVKYDELVHNRVTGREAEVKAELDRVLRQEATRGLDQLPAGADVPEEYRFLMPRARRGGLLSLKNRLETLFFAPHLTPDTLDAFLAMCRKKRFLTGVDRPLVLKNPSDYYFNFWNVHQMLPEAKFIFIHRHPLPMINSYLHSFPGQLTERSNYAASIDLGYDNLFNRPSLRRRLLLRAYRSEKMCRLLTERVAESFEYYLAHVDHLPPQQYVSVRYEDLCADPAACLSRIGEHLELDLAPRVPPEFVAPRSLPLLDRVKRHYAARVADMSRYLESCGYPAWPNDGDGTSGTDAERSSWVGNQQQPA